jgi:uncharacterized protein YkwD
MRITVLSRSAAPARVAMMLAVALVATSAGLASMPGRALGWSDNSFDSASEQQLFTLTNQARASAGLASMSWDSTLAGVARWRSQDMATRDYFSHNIPPSGEMVFAVLDQKGYCYKSAGENLGWNNCPDDEATQVVQNDWMNSAGVCAVSANGVLGDPTGATEILGAELFHLLLEDLEAAVRVWRGGNPPILSDHAWRAPRKPTD